MKTSLVSILSLCLITAGLSISAKAVAMEPSLEPAPRYVVPIERFAQVTPFMYRGARPTQQGIGVLKTLGVKTILNIDNEAGPIALERSWAQALGIRFISIPLSGFFAPSDEQMDQIFKVIHDPSNYPIFLHCKHGEDRTGLVVGLYRYYDQHWPAKAAYEEMLSHGFHKVLLGLNHYFKEKTGYTDDVRSLRVSNDESQLLGELQ